MNRSLRRNGAIGGGRSPIDGGGRVGATIVTAAGLFMARVAGVAAEVSGPLDPTATRGAFTTGHQFDFYAPAFGAAVLVAGGLLALRGRIRRKRGEQGQ